MTMLNINLWFCRVDDIDLIYHTSLILAREQTGLLRASTRDQRWSEGPAGNALDHPYCLF